MLIGSEPIVKPFAIGEWVVMNDEVKAPTADVDFNPVLVGGIAEVGQGIPTM